LAYCVRVKVSNGRGKKKDCLKKKKKEGSGRGKRGSKVTLGWPSQVER